MTRGADTINGFTITRETFAHCINGKKVRRITGYTLTDPDGAYLMIAGHGCVSPTYRAAVLERETRLAQEVSR